MSYVLCLVSCDLCLVFCDLCLVSGFTFIRICVSKDTQVAADTAGKMGCKGRACIMKLQLRIFATT